jgi:hypothetical protein
MTVLKPGDSSTRLIDRETELTDQELERLGKDGWRLVSKVPWFSNRGHQLVRHTLKHINSMGAI